MDKRIVTVGGGVSSFCLITKMIDDSLYSC